MGSLGILGLAVIVLWVQAFSCSYCEEDPPCRPGFSSETFIFKVHRTHLQKGRRLGRVLFNDCSGRQRALFYAQDTRFNVDTDGTVSLKRPVNLYDGHKSFSVHAWDSKGKKFTTRVWVQYEPSTIHQQEVDTVAHEQSDSTPSVPVLDLPWSSSGLKRRKRDWIIPPIKIQENQKGPFPKPVVKIRSSNDKEAQMLYSITGQGADQPPKGLFTMDKNSGQLFVTQPLDREKQASYTLVAHSVAVGAGQAEEPMEIIIEVIDMNDNKPVFTQTTFEGSVPEAAREGYDILIVTATDADDPSTHNGELVYNILSQEPVLPKNNMFAINPTSGQIRLSSTGLDREKYPQYTLTVEATDLAGEGFSTTCRVIIKVTDSNDNAPQFPHPVYLASVPENKKDAEVARMFVFTKFHIIQGNDEGFFNITNGVITTVKPLDFEKKRQHTLLVTVENQIPLINTHTTVTATVIVNVGDMNED